MTRMKIENTPKHTVYGVYIIHTSNMNMNMSMSMSICERNSSNRANEVQDK